ncbi:MAG TPA: hypothetical protein VJL89_04210 [Thermodesulfovibrionia bacterium]|nr:hypothetical protein [Thermodesulfovibrionia bacterium]
MGKYVAFLLCIVAALVFCPQVEAGDWDRCKVCHRPNGKPGPSMTTLKQKYMTEDEFVKAALSSSTPMMAFVRQDEKLLHNVAKEIKIGEIEKPQIEEEYPTAGIDAKKIIEDRCTTCHNINRVVYAPEYTSADWLHIIARMEGQSKGLMTPEEMVAVVDWLYGHHDELKPVQVSGEEALVSANIPPETKEILIQNNCIVCHADDQILDQAGAWTKEDWEHIIERMRARAPVLLKDVVPVDVASHLFDKYGGLVRTGAKKVTELGDIYYRLYGNFQLWGEYRHAYDFNDDVTDDDQFDVRGPFNDSNRRGRSTDPRMSKGFYETRNLASAEVFDPSKWMLHGTVGLDVLNDNGNDVLGKGDPFFGGHNTYRDEIHDNMEVDPAYEEAWFEWQFPYNIRARAGLQDYMTDFIGSIYSDTDLGLRIYGNVEDVEWSVYGAHRLENDLISRFNDDDDRDQQLVLTHMLFKVGDTAFKPSIQYNSDHEGDHGFGRTHPDEEVDVVYLGNTTYGPDPFGLGLNILTGIYGVFGEQKNATINGIDVRNLLRTTRLPGIAEDKHSGDYDPDQNVAAYLFYFDISKPLFNNMLTPHTGLYYASGDDDILDDDANGFDAISDDVNVWGDRGILIDDHLTIRARGLEPLLSETGPLGKNNLTSKTNPFLPGRQLAQRRSSSITILRDNSPYPALRDADARSNFMNPGVIAYNLGTGFAPATWIDGNFNFTYFWFEEPEILDRLTQALSIFNPRGQSPWNPGTGSTSNGGITRDVGFEFSADANFHVTTKFSVFSGAAIFVPDEDNFERLFGDSNPATNFMVGMQYKF